MRLIFNVRIVKSKHNLFGALGPEAALFDILPAEKCKQTASGGLARVGRATGQTLYDSFGFA